MVAPEGKTVLSLMCSAPFSRRDAGAETSGTHRGGSSSKEKELPAPVAPILYVTGTFPYFRSECPLSRSVL